MEVLEEYLELIQEEELQEFIVIPLMIAAGVKAYDRYFSTAAKGCEQLSGKKKTVCVLTHKLKALEKAKYAVKKAMKKCGTAQCKEKGVKTVHKYDKKISKTKQDLRKVKKLARSPGLRTKLW